MGKHIKQKNDISCTDEICTVLHGLPYRFTVDGTKKRRTTIYKNIALNYIIR